MKKKVKKFASGGDILTAAGAILLGKHLYDKYKEGKGKDDEDSDYARKVKEFKSNKKDVEAVTETKEEPKTISAGEKRAMAASKGRPELIPEDADEAKMRSDNYPSRKSVVTTTPKKAASTASAAKKTTPSYTDVVPSKDLGSQSFSSGALKSKPYPQAEATARLKKAEAARRVGQGLTPRAEYTGPGSRQHIEGLRLERSQRLEEEAKKQFEKNKRENEGMKRGGAVKKYASGGSVSSASKRADGIAQRGKTRGKVC